jgi:hypothetical protein
MKSRLLHNIVLALVVAGLALFLLLKPEKAGPQKFRLSQLQAGAITQVTLAPAKRDTIVLEKRGEDWRMSAPFPARADANRVASTLEILQAQSETRLPAQDLQKFELDQPFVRLRVKDQAKEQEFIFGGRQPVSNQIYVATEGHVYLVSPTYLMDVVRGPGDFASKKLLAESDSIAGFAMPELKLTLKDGRWQREPNDGKLSADQLNRYADEWRLALAMSVDKASDAKPLERLRLTLASGKTVAISLIARDPEVVLRREDEALDYRFPRDVGERLLNPAAHAKQP